MFSTLSVNSARLSWLFGGSEPCACLIVCFFESLVCLFNDGLALRIGEDDSMVVYFPSLTESF